jgi:Fic family protein
MTSNLESLPPSNLQETTAILKKLALAHRQLAELKGFAVSIPNQSILIETLALQEAKYSSAIENIITTQDAMFKQQVLGDIVSDPAAKEVSQYSDALKFGFELVRQNHMLTVNHVLGIHSRLVPSSQGIRKLPGTRLINPATREVVYTPPQDYETVRRLMDNLVKYINEPEIQDIDPLVKMAVIHYQFESIHPFYDGNGRVGRIINVLFLVLSDLLRLPILYLSRYIIRNKSEYYTLLRTLPETGNWEPWVLYMLDAVEQTSKETIVLINAIRELMLQYKHGIREKLPKIYSQDLINNLFRHPYTKIDFVMRDLKVTRPTASKYLGALVKNGFLQKAKIGTSNYYINAPLFNLFAKDSQANSEGEEVEIMTSEEQV